MSALPEQPTARAKTPVQRGALVLAPLLASALLFLPPPGTLGFEAWALTALIAWMVAWWVTEAVPIPVTSLLPVVFLPLLGIADITAAAAPYASPIVALLLGGFVVAKAVERWGLHERLALLTVIRAGGSPQALVAGFLVAAALLSAWISNTATTIMLMPVALSVAYALGVRRGAGEALGVALVLAVAYGASIGGLATPIGTPTNLIVLGVLEGAGDTRIDFATWMAFGVPAVLILLPAAWVVLTKLSGRLDGGALAGGDARFVLRERLTRLGAWTPPERRTLIVFAVIALFWVFRRAFIQDLLLLGIQPFAGLTDPVIAVAGAVAMFLVPSGSKAEPGTMLLDWPTARSIPWDVLLLFGGGLSLALVITTTGLGDAMGRGMEGLAGLPSLLLILTLALFVIFATELTSNVATAAALMPVILAMATATGLDPASLAVPVAMAASCAFMFPMATAPNAIAYGTGEVTIPRMARVGVKLNLIGVVLIAGLAQVIVPLVLPG